MRSSGKTTFSIGLSYTLYTMGLKVQTFKKGPDYIDPLWLSSASQRPCYNLDQHMMGEDQIMKSFLKRSIGSDINIIEGNMGLYDSVDLQGEGSSAHLAKQLKAPVVLVMNAKGMTRGIAPIIQGLLNFDKDLNFAGVILNKVRGKRHENKLRESIEYYCDIDVLGVLANSDDMEIEERHLGLTPVIENEKLIKLLDPIGTIIKENVDCEKIIEKANQVEKLNYSGELILNYEDNNSEKAIEEKVRIAIPRDEAFSFYYLENLEALEQGGAELIYFNSLKDKHLPEIDGLYLGGGFPEMFLNELEDNISLRKQLKELIDKGLPVYAECGGLMYLCKSISYKGTKKEMLSVLDYDVVQQDKPIGFGYINLEKKDQCWLNIDNTIHAHEFHYSELMDVPETESFAYQVIRGRGISGKTDGILYKNVLASYAHLHIMSIPNWAKDFIQFIKKVNFQKHF